ncbi:hypothetical protein CIPAW_05G215100 [Carya illinoinensis]|uniref:Uncharacterized protein n=1 Tax=Carya illinoinensis TaxID=32201 RepID=A0A8T1QLT5_CARIL|nr:hypothetical protein CIPAW_05G215100 [Carya illinoinensis]
MGKIHLDPSGIHSSWVMIFHFKVGFMVKKWRRWWLVLSVHQGVYGGGGSKQWKYKNEGKADNLFDERFQPQVALIRSSSRENQPPYKTLKRAILGATGVASPPRPLSPCQPTFFLFI